MGVWAGDHVMGLELQVEELAGRRARAFAQERSDDARTLSAPIATLYDEWGRS